MKPLALHLLLASLLLTLGSNASAAMAHTDETNACDRACLKSVTARYLDAMAAGKLEDIRVSPAARATSNGEDVSPGAGPTWTGGITIVNRMTFVDPRTQTAIFFGTLAGPPVEEVEDARVWWHYAVRLTVNKAGAIVEIEEQSTTGGMQTADKVEIPFKEASLFREVIAQAERTDADTLVEIADGYWDALTSGEGSDAAFGPDCQRTEFGKFSTNNPITPHGRGENGQPSPQVGPSCGAFFERPRFRWPVSNRRYYIADEERGVVVGIGQLNRSGTDGNDPLTLFEALQQPRVRPGRDAAAPRRDEAAGAAAAKRRAPGDEPVHGDERRGFV